MPFLDPSFLSRLSRRERSLLTLGGVVVLGFVLWGIISAGQWYFERMNTLDRLVREKQQALLELNHLRQEHNAYKDQMDKLEARISTVEESFSILSFMEATAERLGMRSNIAHMRPQAPQDFGNYREVGVEIKIQNVTLEQVVRILSSIEDAPHLIRIKELRMRTRFSDPQFLDVTFLAASYEKSSSS